MKQITDSSGFTRAEERRKYGRYRLVMPVTGFVERNFRRYVGRVIDVSGGGFQLFVPGISDIAFDLPGHTDFGEIVVQERLVGGFGNVAFRRQVAHGLSLGFEWDESVFTAHSTVLSSVIQDLILQKNAGSAVILHGRIFLRGHVSSVLSGDVFNAVSKGIRRISLEEITSIDSGGLDMLMGLQEVGVFLDSCPSEMEHVLKRFLHLVAA